MKTYYITSLRLTYKSLQIQNKKIWIIFYLLTLKNLIKNSMRIKQTPYLPQFLLEKKRVSYYYEI